MNNNPLPPRLFLCFFRWFCHPDLVRYIEGDLIELFEERVREKGVRKARWLFGWDVVKLFRPGIIRPAGGTYRMNGYGMFKNYFKITWRNLLRQKLYASINIGGLAVGLICFILIFHYVHHELSYDRFYANADRIYRIYQRQPGNASNGTDLKAVTPAALPSELIAKYPEVESATSLVAPRILLETGEFSNYFEKGIMADENYFNVFHHEFILGSPQFALKNAESIVLTESLAKRLFGDKDAMGQKIVFWGREAFVTGVIKDLPQNSSLKYTCLISIKVSSQYTEERNKDQWNGNSYHTFLTLKKGTDVNEFQQKIQQIVADHWAAQDIIPSEYLVQPLSDLHLQLKVNEDVGLKGNANQLLLFSIVCILILILACVNCMNLAIARSINRAKEVGLRKVIGAQKGQLTFQFLFESVVLAFLALLIVFITVPFLLPLFGHLVERPLTLNFEEQWYLPPMLIGVALLVGLMSGSYPAFFMSSLKPIKVLKGKFGNQRSSQKFQHGMIIGQYSISMFMIICSVVIYSQFQFISQKELGFDKEHILTIRMNNAIRKNMEIIKSEWANNANILGVTASSDLPTRIGSSTFLHNNDRSGGKIYRLRTDYNFFDTYGMDLIEGRNFSPNYSLDKESNYIINETAARALGWTPEQAIGQQFTNEEGNTKTVIGVVKDFHMHSMYEPIAPLMIRLSDHVDHLSVKIRPERINETIAYLEETLQSFSPYSFEYRFVDDHFNSLYKFDRQQGQIFGLFTVLAIVIACLGLFGLAAFNASQRVKEFGIRKVLGAGIKVLVLGFSKKFISLVLIGFAIAAPVAWYLIGFWLNDFAYRVELEWWMFVLTGLGAMIIAFLTISSQSIKAALTNPVNCLRDE